MGWKPILLIPIKFLEKLTMILSQFLINFLTHGTLSMFSLHFYGMIPFYFKKF